MSKPGQFLIALSGGRPEILELCPGERIKFQSLGWVILITSGMAVVSMWFALTSALGVHAYAALPFALLWGLVIMGVDRWLVTSLPYDRTNKWLIVAPRLALAILLGALISTPIVLRVFESEINNQISVIKQENAATFIASQQRSAVQQQVTKWQDTVDNLRRVIESGGAAPINPNNDPIVQGLNSQLKAAQSQANKDYAEWQCQLYGRGNCSAPRGNGPLAQASEGRYYADVQQVSSLQNQIKNREAELQANDQASQQRRLQQAQQQLPEAQAQLTLAQNRETALANSFDATNESTNGLLIRLQALDQLTAKGGTASVVRWLLFLLFLVIEVLPVSVKLMMQPGQYEAILETANQNELRRAKWALRSGGIPGPPYGPADGLGVPVDPSLRPSIRDGGHHARRQPRDMSSADLLKLFQRTADAPIRPARHPEPGWSPTERSPVGVDSSGPNLLDEELRDLADARPGATLNERFGDQFTPGDAYDDRNTGIERRYGEDDL